MKVKLSNVSMLQNHPFFLTFFNSLKCVGSLIEKFYIQTVPGTKHHRFLVSFIFLLHLPFFRHNKRLRRREHLQRKETISCEPYFSGFCVSGVTPCTHFVPFQVTIASTVPPTQALPACLLRSLHRAWQAHCSLLGYEVSNLG